MADSTSVFFVTDWVLNYTEQSDKRVVKMAIQAICLLTIWFLASSNALQPCGVSQCNVAPVRGDLAVIFQQLATEKDVRLVYFNLEFGNDSFHPLESNERLLAKRWIWAKTIQEPMLRMTDNEYDIYSLGLLTRQKRYMSVQLEEKPPRCLAQLNTSCQDNVVAEALLGNITNLSPGNRLPQTGSVCTYRKKNSPSQGKGWKNLCCSLQNNAEGNHTIVQCGFALGNVWSAKLFQGVYYLLVFTLWIYAPGIPLLIPDWLFNVQHERDKEKKEQPASNLVGPRQVSPIEHQDIEMTDITQTSQQAPGQFIEDIIDVYSDSSEETDSKLEENSSTHHKYHELSNEIPVEDDSLIISALLRYFIKELPQIQVNFNLKLFFFIFVVFPIFLYLKLAVACFYNLEYYQEVSRKSHQHCADDGQFLAICSSALFVDFGRQWKLTVFGTTVLFFCVLLLVVLPFIRPKDLLPPLGPFIFEQLKEQRKRVFHFTFYMLHRYMGLLKTSLMKLSLSCRTGKSRRRRAFRFMCDFLSIFPKFLIGATLSFASILIFLIGLFVIFTMFSPFTSFLTFFLLKKLTIISKSIFKASGSHSIHYYLIPAVLSITTSAIFITSLILVLQASVAFIMTIFFLTIVGLVLNYEFVSPYVVFISVVAANTYLCYSNLLSRYREVKGMISKHWEEETKDLSWIKCRNNGTIPKELFWSVCGNEWDFKESEMQILPLTTEIFFMFRDMALVVFFLCLFFFAVIAFETMEEMSALVSTFFVFISGVIPTLIFKRFTRKKQFSGWDKIKIDNKIKEAVRKYALSKMEEIPYPYEASEPPTACL